MENLDYINDLFHRYTENKCSLQEVEILLNYFRLDGDEEQQLRTLIRKYLQSPVAEDDAAIRAAVKKGYDQIRKEISENRANVVPIKKGLFIRIAIAASILLATSITLLKWQHLYNWLNPVSYQTTITRIGERKIIQLADGTKVWLSPMSTLNYPDLFHRKIREVSLTGEAFFEVAKDHAHPFIIHTGNINTQVLGTSFNLKSYGKKKNITVTLLTGKVLFGSGSHKVLLTPNQRAIFLKDNGHVIKENYSNAIELIERRNGNYQFNNVAVSEVVADLTRNYNIEIKVEGNIAKRLFFGRIKKNETPQKFLRKLCHVVNAKLSQTGETYIITEGAGA